MTLYEAIPLRHSVRAFLPKPVEPEKLSILQAEIDKYSDKAKMTLVANDKKVFSGVLAFIQKFRNVPCSILVEGTRNGGFYGERIVLLAQTLGLNTCWVGLTFNKKAAKSHAAHTKMLAIALGYGETQGKQRKSKTYADVSDVQDAPQWFRQGVEAALLAPTALNKQNFRVTLTPDGKPEFSYKPGMYSEIDLGIVESNFFIAAKEHGYPTSEPEK